MFGNQGQKSRRFGLLRGALLAASPVPWAVVSELHSGGSTWTVVAAFALSALALAASALVVERPWAGRWLATSLLLGVLGLAFDRLVSNPLTALLAIVIATGGVAFLWSPSHAAPSGRSAAWVQRARGAAIVAAGSWVVATLTPGTEDDGLLLPAVGLSVVVSLLYVVGWSMQARGHWPLLAIAAACSSLAAAVGIVASAGRSWPLVSLGLLVALVWWRLTPTQERRDPRGTGGWGLLTEQPERLLVGTFGLLSIVGCLVLALPISSATGTGIALIDAFFTAVSAVCVTGLVVLDTPHAFSTFGQVALLVLIQLGGLGIMTFSTTILDLLGQRLSLKHEGAVARLLGARGRGGVRYAARLVLVTTFVLEGLGALFLAVAFWAAGDPLGTALWRGTFTSVSAFCNAGFALQADSLLAYQTNPWVLQGVAILIVAGGLSPPAILALPALMRGRHRSVSAQLKLGLVTSAILLVGGFALFLAFEWGQTLHDLSAFDRLSNAWFQSVTLRTAGFNSVDLSAARPATLLVMMVWMFIGGCPGGTAGGVKTTTAAVLVISVVKSVRGLTAIDAFGRQLGHATRHRAALVVSLGFASFMLASLAILLTQTLTLTEAAFEVVSALGTVGLSIGGTARLDEIGKIIIACTMFAGRVGSLSLLLFLGQRPLPFDSERPEEVIDVG